ncbi:MAG: hypothetical protein JST85_00860 [Acidobacteria bacterium]|nr:hypothetical protein [Acidobacteriota bacterium]
MRNEQIPDFSFFPPPGYLWLIDRGLVGFDPFSGLQPWHYLDKKNSFSVNERWPGKDLLDTDLIAFAKRQDSDDLACFKVHISEAVAIVIVNGWTSNGYDIITEYQSFWEWLKSVVDDIAEWVELPVV